MRSTVLEKTLSFLLVFVFLKRGGKGNQPPFLTQTIVNTVQLLHFIGVNFFRKREFCEKIHKG